MAWGLNDGVGGLGIIRTLGVSVEWGGVGVSKQRQKLLLYLKLN